MLSSNKPQYSSNFLEATSLLDKMDGCNKYSETDTLPLTKRILSSAPVKQWQYHRNNGWLQLVLPNNKLSFKKSMPAAKEIL